MLLLFLIFGLFIGRGSHQFKIPALRKTKSRENVKRNKTEEGGELKKELLQAVKHRTKSVLHINGVFLVVGLFSLRKINRLFQTKCRN